VYCRGPVECIIADSLIDLFRTVHRPPARYWLFNNSELAHAVWGRETLGGTPEASAHHCSSATIQVGIGVTLRSNQFGWANNGSRKTSPGGVF
jgi:hypothetical protein